MSTDASGTPATDTVPRTSTYTMWLKASARRGGSLAFSAAVSLRAPYFRTVNPHVVEMEPGRCVVRARKWWGVQNHIGTFHAIAACNLAEMAMGMLAEATVPTTHRWIPKGMTSQYKTKTKGGLTATAQLPEIPDFSTITSGQDLVVPISLIDDSGVESVHAEITIWVTPKKK